MSDTRPEIPPLMDAMAHALDVSVKDQMTDQEQEAAVGRCHSCTDTDACREWLMSNAIRGAERPPAFCRNAALFEQLSAEVDTTL